MNHKSLIAFCSLVGVSVTFAGELERYFGNLPEGTDPGTVSRRIADQFLTTRPENYFPAGYHGNNGYGWNRAVQYSVVSLWLNAIECAHLDGDANREARLVRLFDDFLPGGRKNRCCSRPYHVDDTIFGALPYEIYLMNGDKRCLEMGNFYADTQWTPPCEAVAKERHNNSLERQAEYWKEGYTPQTRLWIDDMYMITVLQSQAYRVTGERKYIDRAAKEMCFYLDKLQLKEGPAKGLFYHAPDVPYVWARGDGWMAAGMALVLDRLPEDSPYRARIMAGYRAMMAALLKYQRPDGLWCQLIDRPDDPANWGETSGTAMFTYAFAVGVRRGWLDGAAYGPAACKAYLALCAKMDAFANLADVCVGTGKKNDLAYYYARPRVNGDPHGQAPMLWIASVLMEDGAGRVKGVRTPATSKLFEKRIDPETGVVSYALVYGDRKDNRQSVYFTCKSMTDDGRFLVFNYTKGNERSKKGAGPRQTFVADLLKDAVFELPRVKGIPFVEVKENYLVYGCEDGFFRYDLANPAVGRKLCDVPAELKTLGKLRYLYTHLTLTKDRQKAFLESSWISGATTNYVQGLVNLTTGAYESWGKTDFFCNHGQINPVRDDLAMCAWENCFRSADGQAFRKRTGIYPRMWLVYPDGRRELVPAKEKNYASHEIWDDDGTGFSWCGGGVQHHDLATGKQECWCPIAGARHNMVSPDKRFVVYDEAPEKWWRGCRWRVGFWNRETKRNVWVYSTRPALMPKTHESRLHPDPHPHFVCGAKYVISTANNGDGHMDLYVTPVAQLVERTTMSAPQGKTVRVTNAAAVARPAETVEVKWTDLGLRAGDPAVRVWDVANMNPVPFQDDGRGNLIFSAAFQPGETREFAVLADAKLPQADLSIVCWSQYLPERMDDYAWENDRFGARVYGPIIMEPAPAGQKLVSSGIDIINKCVREPVLHRWFVERTGEGSYHKDHGEGMDNYKVGPSRGCGALGALGTDGWAFSKNWIKTKTLSIGPVRTEFELVYAPWGGFGEERRIVRLDRGQYFTRFAAKFKGTRPDGVKVGPGLDCDKARQHDGQIVRNLEEGWLANFEPDGVDVKDSGSIMTGVLLDPKAKGATTATDALGCEYLFPQAASGDLVWWAGAAWTGAREIFDAKTWHQTVRDFAAALRSPLKVEVR